jgi:predicted RNA-binding Zn ribbon-like protein
MPVSSELHDGDDPRPPHGLQLVIDFVNTRDLDEDTEALDSPAALGGWLAEHELIEPAATDEQALTDSLELREALRAVLLAHNGGPEAPAALATLERAAERGRLSVVFHADGSVAPAPRASGIDGALARLLVPVAQAAGDGTWARVKACPADDCQWAFYDFSRNRSGRWCNMAVCGNRHKVRAYRSKRSD